MYYNKIPQNFRFKNLTAEASLTLDTVSPQASMVKPSQQFAQRIFYVLLLMMFAPPPSVWPVMDQGPLPAKSSRHFLQNLAPAPPPAPTTLLACHSFCKPRKSFWKEVIKNILQTNKNTQHKKNLKYKMQDLKNTVTNK